MLIDDLYPDVALRIPGAPDQLIESCVVSAIARFCRESTLWRERFRTLTLVSGKADYDLSMLPEHPVCAITDVRLLGSQLPIPSITEQEIGRLAPDWRAQQARTPTRYLAPSGPDQLRLYPMPNESGAKLDIELALFPGRESEEIPDWIGQMYFDDLVAGACALLYGMPKKEWSSSSDAALGEQRLLDAARSARVRVEKSNTRGIVTMVTTGFDQL